MRDTTGVWSGYLLFIFWITCLSSFLFFKKPRADFPSLTPVGEGMVSPPSRRHSTASEEERNPTSSSSTIFSVSTGRDSQVRTLLALDVPSLGPYLTTLLLLQPNVTLLCGPRGKLTVVVSSR